MTRCLVLAVGDTSGHVLPALAIAEAYRARVASLEVRFLAAGEGSGHRLITQAGHQLEIVPGSALARATPVDQALALTRAASGAARSRRLLSTWQTRLVIGTGGYGSAGAVLAGWSLGLRTALVEPNVVPGLANRLLGRLVDRAWVAFDETAAHFPPGRAVLRGVPLRRLGRATAGPRTPPQLPRLRVLVMSGSRGEGFFTSRVPALLEALTATGLSVEAWHQGGTSTEEVTAAYARAGIEARVDPFIDEIGDALAWADIAITRAGAGTIAELSASGLPALLVPLGDAAHDHQTVNALALAARGAALVVRESEWHTAPAAAAVVRLVTSESAWASAAAAVHTALPHDAAARIVDDCESLMAGRW